MTEPQTEAGKALMRFMGWGPAWAKKILAIEDEMEAHLSPPPVAAVAPGNLDYESDWYRKGWLAGNAAADAEHNAALTGEAAAPGAAALDRGLVRLAMNAAWTAPHDFEAAVEVFIREYERLGARAAEPNR